MPKGEKTKLLWKDPVYRASLVKSHSGKKQSKEQIAKRVEKMKADKHPLWKGDEIDYNGLHQWVRRNFGKPEKCEHCEMDGLKGKFIQWANKTGQYRRDREDWLRLCAKCHFKFDKRNFKPKTSAI